MNASSSSYRPPVALDLLQVLALVAQQALVVFVAWKHVDRAPEARPAFEAAQAHVSGDQAGGGADDHVICAHPVSAEEVFCQNPGKDPFLG